MTNQRRLLSTKNEVQTSTPSESGPHGKTSTSSELGPHYKLFLHMSRAARKNTSSKSRIRKKKYDIINNLTQENFLEDVKNKSSIKNLNINKSSGQSKTSMNKFVQYLRNLEKISL